MDAKDEEHRNGWVASNNSSRTGLKVVENFVEHALQMNGESKCLGVCMIREEVNNCLGWFQKHCKPIVTA